MENSLIMILGGLCIALISGSIGTKLADRDSISENHCQERQNSCQKLMLEKIDNLDKKLDSLTKAFFKRFPQER